MIPCKKGLTTIQQSLRSANEFPVNSHTHGDLMILQLRKNGSEKKSKYSQTYVKGKL